MEVSLLLKPLFTLLLLLICVVIDSLFVTCALIMKLTVSGPVPEVAEAFRASRDIRSKD